VKKSCIHDNKNRWVTFVVVLAFENIQRCKNTRAVVRETLCNKGRLCLSVTVCQS